MYHDVHNVWNICRNYVQFPSLYSTTYGPHLKSMHHQIIYVQWNYIWRPHHDRMEIKEVCTGQSVRLFLSIFVSTSLIMYSKPEQLISNPVSSTQYSTTTFFWWNLKHFFLNNFHSYYTGVWIQWHVIRRQCSPRVELSGIFDWIIFLTVFQYW